VKKRVHAVVAASLAFGLWAGCDRGRPATSPPSAPRRQVTYDGGTSISDRILPLALPVLAQRTGVVVDVSRSGAGRGLAAMFAGKVDVAGLSRALTPEERDRGPFVAIIGYDALAVWVSDQNPVRALTRSQLRDLFTGRITSWRQLGGRDRPVVVCTEQLDSQRATLEAFRQLVLEGAPYGPVVERRDPASCLDLVATNPDAVTPASAAYDRPALHTVTVDGVIPAPPHVRNGSYPMRRPLLLVTREPPTGDVKALVDFLLSADGQALVVQAGFVAAR
jgi:phosphate transport system substrate-binding protein